MKTGKTTFYVNEKFSALLEKYMPRANAGRGRSQGQSWTVTEQWSRFDALLKIDRRTVRAMFTELEVLLMLNNMLSTVYTAETIPGAVLADTEDEIPETFELYGVDRAMLLDKLRGLNVGQQFALVDWLEEMRAGVGKEKT